MEKKIGISENEKENYAKHVLVNFSNHAWTKVSNKQKKKQVLAQFVKLLIEIKYTINQEAFSAHA
jgi:hypothetical protein